MKRVAFAQAFGSEHKPFKKSFLFDSFYGVRRACGGEAAVAAQKGADRDAVKAYEEDEGILH